MNKAQQVSGDIQEKGVGKKNLKMTYLLLLVPLLFVMIVVLVTFLPSKKEVKKEIEVYGYFEEAGEDGNPKGWTTETRRIKDVD